MTIEKFEAIESSLNRTHKFIESSDECEIRLKSIAQVYDAANHGFPIHIREVKYEDRIVRYSYIKIAWEDLMKLGY